MNFKNILSILLDTFAKIMIGLICLIGTVLILSIIFIAIIGCIKFPMIVIPIVVILLSYAIGREALNDR